MPDMHLDQHRIDEPVVRRLVAAQFPQWRDLSVTPVAGSGTVNAIFRLGDGLGARFPLVGADPVEVRRMLEAEASASSLFAGVSPFPAPRPAAIAAPGEGYPLPWTVQTWIAGDVASPDAVADSNGFAADLAVLIGVLRAVDTGGRTFSGSGRGGDLREQDAWMEVCIGESESLLDARRLRSVWAVLRDLPRRGPDVMSHGDLTPANVLVRGGRLAGVLDAGGFGPADPALELVAAWHLLDAPARGVLRAALGSDDAEWRRGAAWAFAQAMGLVWYYRSTNPVMAHLGRSTVSRVLGDDELGL